MAMGFDIDEEEIKKYLKSKYKHCFLDCLNDEMNMLENIYAKMFGEKEAEQMTTEVANANYGSGYEIAIDEKAVVRDGYDLHELWGYIRASAEKADMREEKSGYFVSNKSNFDDSFVLMLWLLKRNEIFLKYVSKWIAFEYGEVTEDMIEMLERRATS